MIDRTAPFFSNSDLVTVVKCQVPASLQNISAFDYGDNKSISITNTFTSVAGACSTNYVQLLTHIARDSRGNVARLTRLIQVVSLDPPKFNTTVASFLNLTCGLIPSPPIVFFTSSCNSTLQQALYIQTPSQYTCREPFIERLWIAKDVCGIENRMLQIIQVRSNCNPNPCLNEATCVDKQNSFECICLPGFGGNDCSTILMTNVSFICPLFIPAGLTDYCRLIPRLLNNPVYALGSKVAVFLVNSTRDLISFPSLNRVLNSFNFSISTPRDFTRPLTIGNLFDKTTVTIMITSIPDSSQLTCSQSVLYVGADMTCSSKVFQKSIPIPSQRSSLRFQAFPFGTIINPTSIDQSFGYSLNFTYRADISPRNTGFVNITDGFSVFNLIIYTAIDATSRFNCSTTIAAVNTPITCFIFPKSNNISVFALPTDTAFRFNDGNSGGQFSMLTTQPSPIISFQYRTPLTPSTVSINVGNIGLLGIIIRLAAPRISIQPTFQSAKTGDKFTLLVVASDPTFVSYQWFKIDTRNNTAIAIPGATNANYTVLNASPQIHEGQYFVVLSQPNTISSTTSVTVFVSVSDCGCENSGTCNGTSGCICRELYQGVNCEKITCRIGSNPNMTINGIPVRKSGNVISGILNSTRGNDVVSITLEIPDAITTTSNLRFTLGTRYTGVITNLIRSTSSSVLVTLTFNTPSGVGANLTLSILLTTGLNTQIDCTNSSQASVSYALSYPKPIIFPNTLRNTLSGPGTNSFKSQFTSGETIYFDGRYFGTEFSLVSILMLSKRLSEGAECILATANNETTDSRIACQTSNEINDENMIFQVIIDNQVANGTDTYSYPSAPSITKVTGCTPDSFFPSRTTLCPTLGNITLTIFGASLSESVSIYVDGKLCPRTGGETIVGAITCILPSGTGSNRTVIAVAPSLRSGTATSLSLPFLSYARPIITGVKGCDSPNNFTNNLFNCSRSQLNQLIIQGSYFGLSGARVLVGGTECQSVCHGGQLRNASLSSSILFCNTTVPAILADSIISCQFPPATTLNRPIQVIQQNAQLNIPSSTVSFQQCQPGTFEQGNNCVNCSFGTYSNQIAQTVCKNCNPGEFSNITGATSCNLCLPGRYSDFSARICQLCPIGKYNVLFGMPSCLVIIIVVSSLSFISCK